MTQKRWISLTFSISAGMSSESRSFNVCCFAAVEAKRAVRAKDVRGVWRGWVVSATQDHWVGCVYLSENGPEGDSRHGKED